MSGVQSIERAFNLLRALSIGPAGVTELADRTDLPKSTVARLLAALAAEGAVERNEIGGEYQLGGELLELAQSATPARSLIATARPFLTELTAATGETSGISVLEGDEVRYLDAVPSEEEVQVRDWTGEAVPFNLVPSGFVLMSGRPAEEIDRRLAEPLAVGTDRSLSTPEEVRRRLDEARRCGFAWAYGEYDEGLNSLAAAVIDRRGARVASVHIHGPAYRFPEPDTAERIAQLLVDSARRLAKRLP